MKILESAPERYDLGMRILSLGRIDAAYEAVAATAVQSSDCNVLEIGCGTGNLTRGLLSRGARVVAVDMSPDMLALARQKLEAFGGRVELREMAAVEIADRFRAASFDVAVSMLAFSEMSADERDYVARAALRVLRVGGHLVVADEVRSRRFAPRLLRGLVRLPLAAVTYLLTQTTTHALIDLPGMAEHAGFRVVQDRVLPGNIGLVVAERPQEMAKEVAQ